jgi:hypothetical protein
VFASCKNSVRLDQGKSQQVHVLKIFIVAPIDCMSFAIIYIFEIDCYDYVTIC